MTIDQTFVDEAYNQILDDTYWAYLDAGFPPDESALFRYACELIDLGPRLAKEFNLPIDTIRSLLRAAIREVELPS